MATANKTPDVLVRTAGGTWQRPLSQGYVNEDELQSVLDAQPSLIEGVSENARSVREFLTGVGPADLVIVDVDGTITVVECKLARNQEIRRTIMGQVLDYASRLAELTPEDFQRLWTAQNGPSLDQLFEGSPDGRENLAANLRAGVFTLVLAVDAINADLRRIVRYLNTHTTAGMRLLAMELRHAVHASTEILIPTVYGSESADEKDARPASSASLRASTTWTQADVDSWLRERDPGLADSVASLTSELVTHGFRVQEKGSGVFPSYSISGTSSGADVTPLSVYCGEPAVLGCNFAWTTGAGEEALGRYLDEMIAAGAPLKREDVIQAAYRKRVSIPPNWSPTPTGAAFVAATRRLSEPLPTGMETRHLPHDLSS